MKFDNDWDVTAVTYTYTLYMCSQNHAQQKQTRDERSVCIHLHVWLTAGEETELVRFFRSEFMKQNDGFENASQTYRAHKDFWPPAHAQRYASGPGLPRSDEADRRLACGARVHFCNGAGAERAALHLWRSSRGHPSHSLKGRGCRVAALYAATTAG